MLSAFKAQALVELKSRDKSKIESILIHSDQLLVGLSTGALRVYRINSTPTQPDSDPTAPRRDTDEDSSKQSSKPTELLREHEKFSKYKIDQLAVFREANILISLSNGIVSLHDLATYQIQEQLTKSRGASVFAVTSNVVKDNSSGVPTLVSRLAVAVKRRILLWSWYDGELTGDAQEIALASSVKSLTWATGDKILAGLNTNYVMVEVDTQNVKTIVGPGSIGGVSGQDSGRLGGTMTYIGMGATIPIPLATGLGADEMFLARDVNTHFIDRDGTSIKRRQIPWRTAPQAIGYSYPYLLALQETNKGVLEVRNPKTLTLLQSIELPGAILLQVPNPNISLAHQGKGFIVAGDRIVWRMHGLGYNEQISALIEVGALDEAISLLDMIEETLVEDKPQKLREIKIQKAQKLFDEKKFRDALDLFVEAAAPPERVTKLYPAIISGEVEDNTTRPESSPRSPTKKGHRKTDSLTGAGKGLLTSDTASIRSTRTVESVRKEAWSEKDLKFAVRELQAYLADIRRRLQRFFNPDQSIKELSEVETYAQAEDVINVTEQLLGISDLRSVDFDEKLLETAKLVDTTLFRAHMYATPSLAGSLFRISNFCDPDVVMNKLEETERYTDLLDFLYGKRLHRQALERLQKFGQDTATKDIDPQLYGPSRTVAYLQNLSAELIDLILEFAQWPLETNPQKSMEIFIADTENADSLPRTKVLGFLEPLDKALAQRYLEHVVDELNDDTPELHQKLLGLYFQRISEHPPNQDELLNRFTTLLETSSQYSAAKILNLLPRDDPTFYEARAIVFSKMGNHKQALEMYVFKLDDTTKAEEYCNQIHLQALSSQQPQLIRRKSTTNPAEDQSSIYQILLSLYLNPPKDEKPKLVPAIELMARHGARLPASSTLELVPDDLLVQELEFYFRGRIRNEYTTMNNSKVVASLRKVDAVRVQAALLLGDDPDSNGGRGRRVKIDEDRLCGVCYKRLGSSVISIFPDNSVVHLGCASRHQSELNGE